MFEKWSSFRLALIIACSTVIIYLVFRVPPLFSAELPPSFVITLFILGGVSAFFVPLFFFWWLIGAIRDVKRTPEEKTRVARGRVLEYRILLYLGLGMLVIGGLAFLFGETGMFIGIILVFFGLMCAVSGWLGLQEEKKKASRERKTTITGIGALILGIVSVFAASGPYLSIVLGVGAILLAVTAVRAGDTEYGLAGGICGGIGIVVNLYVLSLVVWFI